MYKRQAFKDVENFYRVSIPIAEIGYIYDYVRNDKNFIEKGYSIWWAEHLSALFLYGTKFACIRMSKVKNKFTYG